MRFNVHDMRNWVQPSEGNWVDGAREPGLTIYNDPVEITFRKNDSESRRNLVITQQDGEWIARFYENDKPVHDIVI